MFNQMSSSLQAEVLSIFIGIMRKSERNLLVSIDAQIYEKVLELLSEVDGDVVADLLVDILMVMTSLTINVNEFKLLLRYLKTDNRLWVSDAFETTPCTLTLSLLVEKTCREAAEYIQEPSVPAWTR